MHENNCLEQPRFLICLHHKFSAYWNLKVLDINRKKNWLFPKFFSCLASQIIHADIISLSLNQNSRRENFNEDPLRVLFTQIKNESSLQFSYDSNYVLTLIISLIKYLGQVISNFSVYSRHRKLMMLVNSKLIYGCLSPKNLFVPVGDNSKS